MLWWPWLRVLAPRLRRTSCVDWNWTVFVCLLLHSHFYGEGEASLVSLICCWCSSQQSVCPWGIKWSPVRLRPIIPPQMIDFGLFFTWCAGGIWLSWGPQTIPFLGLGSLNKYFGHSFEKRKSSHFSVVRFLYCLANFRRAARCLAVSRGFFCRLSGLQPSLFMNLQTVFFPHQGLCLLTVVRAASSSNFPFCANLSLERF